MKLRRLTKHAIDTAHAAEDAVILALEARTKAQRAVQEYRQAKVRLKAARKVAKAAKREAGETVAAAATADKAAKRTRKKAERAAKALVKFKARQRGTNSMAPKPAKVKRGAPKSARLTAAPHRRAPATAGHPAVKPVRSTAVSATAA